MGTAVVPGSQSTAYRRALSLPICRFIWIFPQPFQRGLPLTLSYIDSPFAKSLYFFLQFLPSSYLSRSMVCKHVYVWGVTRGNFRKPHSNSDLIGLGREGSGTWASCVLKAPQAIIICKPRLQITSLSECLGLRCVH